MKKAEQRIRKREPRKTDDIRWRNPPGDGYYTHWCKSHRRHTSYIDHTGRRSCHPDRGGACMLCDVVSCTRLEGIQLRAEVLREALDRVESHGPEVDLNQLVEAKRLDMGLTAMEFSKILGVSNSFYGYILDGEYEIPAKSLIRLAGLGMDPAILLAKRKQH